MTVDAVVAPRGNRWHWSVVVGSACLMVAGEFMFLSASILNPDLAASLGVGLSEVMIYNSLQGIGGVLAMMFLAPWLLRRVGIRGVVVASGVWTAVTVGAVAWVPNLPVLYVLGFASGLTYSVGTFMAASLLIMAWFEARRGVVMGAAFAASSLGGVASGLVLPLVVEAGGYRIGFLTLAGVVVALAIVPGLLLIRSDPASVGLRPFGARDHTVGGAATEVPLPGVPAAKAFRTPQFAALSAGIVLVGMVQAVQQHFAPLMVERGVSLTVAGTMISLMALTLVVANIVVGTLSDRLGTRTVVVVVCVCQVAALAGYLVSVGVVPLAVSTMVFAFAATLPGVLFPLVVMLVFGMRDYGAILAPSSAMVPLGFALGTPLWGAALDLTGRYDTALWAGLGITVVATILIVWTINTAPALRSRVERERG